jgi:Phosphatidylinositol-glycan biosynthesis class S protein
MNGCNDLSDCNSKQHYMYNTGVPVWWATTSLERPQLPQASRLDLVPLPVTFHITVVSSEPGQQQLEIPQNFQAALQADAQLAYADGIASKGASGTPHITVCFPPFFSSSSLSMSFAVTSS